MNRAASSRLAATGNAYMPPCRGILTPKRSLADLCWLRVGGPAEWFLQPADREDLASFLRGLPEKTPVFVMGVGSNLIVRDGGIRGVVVRLGRPFAEMRFEGRRAVLGAAALDARVAVAAAEQGIDLTFLRTIPGTIGGAVRMNAGCYGTYVSDKFVSATIVTRTGEIHTLTGDELSFGYRNSSLPKGSIVLEAVLEGEPTERQVLLKRMERYVRRRDETQPGRVRTAGSTFRNPSGASSSIDPTESQEFKAWKLIDEAGMRGKRLGDAQVSPMHPNFLVNLGSATAKDMEELGEEVRSAVYQTRGIRLDWEVDRIGVGKDECWSQGADGQSGNIDQ